MLGIPASHVSLGRSHVCVLTQHGTIYTFGTNQYGQCGRNYIPPSEGMDGPFLFMIYSHYFKV